MAELSMEQGGLRRAAGKSTGERIAAHVFGNKHKPERRRDEHQRCAELCRDAQLLPDLRRLSSHEHGKAQHTQERQRPGEMQGPRGNEQRIHRFGLVLVARPYFTVKVKVPSVACVSTDTACQWTL